MTRPLAGICSCSRPAPPKRADSMRPFSCLRCRRVLSLAHMLTTRDISWLNDNHIGLGRALERELPKLDPPPPS